MAPKKNSRATIPGALKKAAHPKHLWKAIQLQRTKGSHARAYNDPQLKLIAQICPGDFLNYGHFENTELQARDITVNDILRAQTRNAELTVDLVVDRGSPVLDAGCGMGGITRLLLERGMNPVALSPDKYQILNLKSKYPQVPYFEAKFEDIPLEGNAHRFGTVITSESLQYLKLDRALPRLEQVLKPGGRWIAVDYFRVGEARDKSGHIWSEFQQHLTRAGWKIVYQQDHTRNVLPLLRYIHMLGNDVLRPLAEFVFAKLQQKQPGVHYLLEEVVEDLRAKIDKNLDQINPESFLAFKKYYLLAIEKA